MTRLLAMTADLSPRAEYEPPKLHTIGTVQGLTLDDDRNHGFSGDSYAKRWSKNGDYWHWYREHEHENEGHGHSR